MYRRVVPTLAQRDALARFGYALSDATRARILLSLRDGGCYPSDLADEMQVSRQIVSNHLACLRGCGLVVAVPEGRRSRYELADVRIAHALNDLVGLVLAVDRVAIGPKVGVGVESLRRWVLQAQVDGAQRPGATSAEQPRSKNLSERTEISRRPTRF
jgi:DNA-binding transcriptional ArsR family regulator